MTNNSTNPPPALSINGQVTSEAGTVVEHFADSLQELSAGTTYTNDFSKHKERIERTPFNPGTPSKAPLNQPISLDELKYAISQTTDSTPGPDNITGSMMKNLPQEAIIHYLGIMNKIWAEGVFPSLWRRSIIVMIPKPGKNLQDPQNYRPIALTSVPCKIMEKIVNDRLIWQLERTKQIHPAQSGFRRNHSTLDSLIQLQHSITTALDLNQEAATIFFDLKKAYDTTWKRGLLDSLKRSRISGETITFIKNFLQDRTFQIRQGIHHSTIRPQLEGIPQGSVLSCTLFLVAANPILLCLPPELSCTMYADDLTITYSSSRPQALERKLQTTLNSLQRQVEMLGWTFSPEKTKVIKFSRKRTQRDLHLTLNGVDIENVTTHKFLGLTMDSKLSWIPHLRQLKSKCLIRLNIIRKLSSTQWGADPNTLLLIYKTLILPKLSYGAELYMTASETSLKMLLTIHTTALRLCLGAFPTSPSISLCAETGMPPLQKILQEVCVATWFRLQRDPDSQSSKILHPEEEDQPSKIQTFRTVCRSLITEYNIPNMEICPEAYNATPLWELSSPDICKWIAPGPKSQTDPRILKTTFIKHSHNIHGNEIHLFTDGSRTGTGTGYAVASSDLTISSPLPKQSSNYTAELAAILRALQRTITLQQQNITIFSDSLSSLTSLQLYRPPHPTQYRIKLWINLLTKSDKKVTLCWVPSHVGVSGNEKADLLARDAASVPPNRQSPIPLRDALNAVSSTFRGCWDEDWHNTALNKLRIMKPNTTLNPTSGSRHSAAKLTRLRIGHCQFTHSHLLSGESTPVCNECFVLDSVHHSITECHKYSLQRTDLSRKFPNLLLADILKKPTPQLMTFLKRTGLWSQI